MYPKFRRPGHPGEILKNEFLTPLQISPEEFARQLGWTSEKIDKIIHQECEVTEAIALAFAKILGTTPEFWMNLQQRYEQHKV